MPWRQTDPMTERERFVHTYESGKWSMTELCDYFTISRKTGHKWWNRYLEEGKGGLTDRGRAPGSCPHRTAAEIEALIVETRKLHPLWGGPTIVEYLSRLHQGVEFPSPSTASEILKRNGLVKPRRRRRRSNHRGAGVLDPKAANSVWTIDFKGEFRLGNGRYCYPLTVCDAFSRLILCCEGLSSVRGGPAKRRLDLAFRRYGLPEVIRSDNGAPFVGRGLYGLSQLNVWWTKLGIRHDRIRPASPQENPRHERMHRTLKEYTTLPPANTFSAQQRRFDGFVEEFNCVRPHQGIGWEVPASLYVSSERSYPKRLAQPQYAGHLEVRRVGRGWAQQPVWFGAAAYRCRVRIMS